MARKKRTIATEQPKEKQYRTITPKNEEQAEFIECINYNLITIGIGKAGSGKTAVAAGVAADWLAKGFVEKIIISRPVVGAETDFGILPGELKDKIDPFLGPLYTELSQFMNVKKGIEDGTVLVLPVNYMRGCTFKNSFVIVDEVQNCDFNQIKMILTRYGEGTRLVLTGDFTQSDLGYYHKDDFYEVIKLLESGCGEEERIEVYELLTSVRHPLVEVILNALEKRTIKSEIR